MYARLALPRVRLLTGGTLLSRLSPGPAPRSSFHPFTMECNFAPTTWHLRHTTATQHPARQITALFARPGTSERNKDLGSLARVGCGSRKEKARDKNRKKADESRKMGDAKNALLKHRAIMETSSASDFSDKNL